MEYASNKVTLAYHNIFNFPLTSEEIKKWKVGRKFSINNLQFTIKQKANFQFINGRQNVIKERLQNERYSQEKLKIARKVAKLISKISTIKFVGITGALAMNNASKNSDIDLMIITSQGTLWVTRLFVYYTLYAKRYFGEASSAYTLRRPRVKNERDALCLNMWLDESDLKWNKADRNIYTAHEIAQIVPLVNKDNIYEKFLWLNKWILDYWPNAVAVQSTKYKVQRPKFLSTKYYVLCTILEPICFWLQYQYMKSKITREVATPTRAIFHPNDWGKVVMEKLGK